MSDKIVYELDQISPRNIIVLTPRTDETNTNNIDYLKSVINKVFQMRYNDIELDDSSLSYSDKILCMVADYLYDQLHEDHEPSDKIILYPAVVSEEALFFNDRRHHPNCLIFDGLRALGFRGFSYSSGYDGFTVKYYEHAFEKV